MDMTFVFKIAAIGIIVAVMNQMLSKSGREEYATLTTIAGIIVVVMMLIPQVTKLYSMLQSAFGL
ncbi:MAG: stage III sporulation protein AC [Clostridiales bacterium]|jgi:stage III sporulation protein AC|nr:stage III sporulation protein AC [Clostridiales bacterium]